MDQFQTLKSDLTQSRIIAVDSPSIDEGEIAVNTSLIQIIEFTDDGDNKRGAGLVSNG